MKDKFQSAREMFPHTNGIVYFNTAAYGPLPEKTKRAIVENIDLRLAVEKEDIRQMYALKDTLRDDFAILIGAKARQIGLSMNTSTGLDLAAYGLPLKEGDEILVSDVEFPAAVYAWRGASEAKNLKLTFVKSTDREFDLGELEKAISHKTRVIIVSFVQFFNGYKINLAGISELCKKHGIYFVVDAIQGVGAEPINVKEFGIDILACGCQKWLLSPYGSGFFYVSDSVKDKLIPQSITWYAADWQLNHTDLFKYDLPYFDTAEKFEAGYYATLNMLGMKVAIDIIADLGVENIRKHNHALIDRLAGYLKETEFYEIKSSLVENERSSIFTFTCDNHDSLFGYMLENKVKAANREGSIRISVHLFNNENDIDKLIEVLTVYEKNYNCKAAAGAN